MVCPRWWQKAETNLGCKYKPEMDACSVASWASSLPAGSICSVKVLFSFVVSFFSPPLIPSHHWRWAAHPVPHVWVTKMDLIQCLLFRLNLAFAGAQIKGYPCCSTVHCGAPGQEKVCMHPQRVSIDCALYSCAGMTLRNGWDKSCYHCGEMSWSRDSLEVLSCDLDPACVCSDMVWRRENIQLNCLKTSWVLKSPVILIWNTLCN